MSNLHFCSDFHFYHSRIIEYSKRPFSSVEDMNEALIKNWNTVVKPNDEVWDLGDFSFGDYNKTVSVLKRLNGRHNFVMGNHDKVITKNKEELLKSGLLSSIQDYKEIKYNGQMIVLFHFSLRVWNKSHHSSWHAWGHSHDSLSQPYGKSIDVGVDSKVITNEYRPISFDEMKEFMDKIEIKVVDHHDGTRA
jgi:calcineurin-like phosphoesterase family protein